MIRIPERYKDAKFQDVPVAIREKFVQIKSSKKGIFIHGSVGVGKTHAMFALKKQYDTENPYRMAIFWNTGELLQSSRADMDRNGYDKVRAMESLMETEGLIFLDDIGAESPSGWVLEQLYTLINSRYMSMKPMILSSNLSIEKIAEVLGDRIASRIVEMCDVVELTGEDKRLKS
jgi:DNA replication protein DnaC